MNDQPISFSSLIAQSWDRMMALLFWNFSWRKWATLIVIGLLAGQMGASSNFRNRNYSKPRQGKPSASQASASASTVKTSPVEEQKLADTGENPIVSGGNKAVSEGHHSMAQDKKIRLWIVGSIAVAVVLAIIIFFQWLAARFRFVWLNSIIHNKTAIREPLRSYAPVGRSLFFGSLIVGAVVVGFLLFIAGAILGIALMFKAKMGLLGVVASGALFLFSIAAILAMIVADTIIEGISVPKMYFDRSNFWPAVQSAWDLWKQRGGELFKYFAVNAGLRILAGIVASLLTLLMAGIWMACFLPGLALLKSGIIFVKLLGGILALLCFVALMIVSAMIQLPISVFFSNLSLHFLAALDPQYTLPSIDEPPSSAMPGAASPNV